MVILYKDPHGNKVGERVFAGVILISDGHQTTAENEREVKTLRCKIHELKETLRQELVSLLNFVL